MDPSTQIIPARSKREVMDWGLVLASQGIEAAIINDEAGWGLRVGQFDYEPAMAALRQYRVENRGWRWKQKLPGSGILFHWGSLIWGAGMVAFYFWIAVRFPGLKRAGWMDNEAVAAGQGWRLFTAVTLHEDLAHLTGNVVTGCLLLGLAMARYGAGVALLSAFLAGVAGNALGLIFYPNPHQALGASGMVMGALGMLAVPTFSLWRSWRLPAKILLRGVGAAMLILVLVGFAPGTDVVAHVGGFFTGAVFGCALKWMRPETLRKEPVNLITTLALVAIVIATWRMAINSR